mmetsp:Transcript_138351/g.430157  ORF Transcript_138351/g.430157 Transcript_138351/m.430157 type:complete len:322 (-) Transcript_138351:63-1028(-)
MSAATTRFSCTAVARCRRTPGRTLETGPADGGRTSSAPAGRSIPAGSTWSAPTTSAAATAPPGRPPSTPGTGAGTAAASPASRSGTWSPCSLRCSTTWASPGSTLAWGRPWEACRASARPPSGLRGSAVWSASPAARGPSRAALHCGTRSARPSWRTRTGGPGTTTTGGRRRRASTWRARSGRSPTAPATSGSSASARGGSRRPRSARSATSSRSSATSLARARPGTGTTTPTPCCGSPGPSIASPWRPPSPMAASHPSLPDLPGSCSRPWSSGCSATCYSPCGSRRRLRRPCGKRGTAPSPTSNWTRCMGTPPSCTTPRP